MSCSWWERGGNRSHDVTGFRQRRLRGDGRAAVISAGAAADRRPGLAAGHAARVVVRSVQQRREALSVSRLHRSLGRRVLTSLENAAGFLVGADATTAVALTGAAEAVGPVG